MIITVWLLINNNTSLNKEELSSPATQEEKQEVSQLYGFLFDLHGNQLDLMSKVQLFTIIEPIRFNV